MNLSEIPEKPLIAGLNKKPIYAQVTYFFQRDTGEIIAASGVDAWSIYSGKNQRIGTVIAPLKYIGRTDGTMSVKAAREAQQVFKEKGLPAAQEFLRQAQLAEFEEAKKDKTPPVNHDSVDRGGNPINLRTYGN